MKRSAISVKGIARVRLEGSIVIVSEDGKERKTQALDPSQEFHVAFDDFFTVDESERSALHFRVPLSLHIKAE
jgi:hypothetical protein